MNKPFDMYSWRRKYIYLAENDVELNEELLGQEDAIEKFYGDKIQPGTLKLDRSLPGGKYVAKNLEGEDIYFDMGQHHFRVFRIEDWYDYVDTVKGLPVASSEYRQLQDEFNNKKLDYVLFGMPKNQPELEESINEGPEDVDAAYQDTIALIRTKARNLNDDDAYQYHEQLKSFFNRLLQEDHTDNPSDEYTVKPCDMPGEPWAVWEGSKRIKGFKTKEEAEAYADKENKEQNLEEGQEDENLTEAKGIYFVRVSLRDALKAQRLVDDMYRNIGVMVRGEEFLSADPDLIQDLIMDFGTHDIEIEDDNLDFSDHDGHSDSEDMLDLYERYLKED
jgi:hypothetical protein